MLRCQKFSYLLVGVLMGILVSFSFAYANSNIVRLIVDGEDITFNSDVPPQIINGRTLVPARALAERLGASVQWDEKTNSVIVTGKEESTKLSNSDNESQNIIKTTFEGLRAIQIDNEIYFNCVDFNNFFYPDTYELKYNKETGVSLLINCKTQATISVIPAEDLKFNNHLTYIPSKYYPKTATGG